MRVLVDGERGKKTVGRVKYIAVIVIAVAIVLAALLISMGVNHGCLPWEQAEQSPRQGPGMEWECR